MKVAVWDTYVQKKDGNVMHFDIIVKEELKDRDTIYKFGRSFLKDKGEAQGLIDMEHCQLCHLEQPTDEMIQAINNTGFYILEMDDIQSTLPEQPSRTDLILHLRAHYPKYRFADFREKSMDDLKQLLNH